MARNVRAVSRLVVPGRRPRFARQAHVALNRGNALQKDAVAVWRAVGEGMRDFQGRGFGGPYQNSNITMQPTEFGLASKCVPVSQTAITNTGYANVASNAAFDTHAGGAWECWFKVNAISSSAHNPTLIQRADLINGRNGGALYINNNSGAYRLAAYLRNGAGTTTDLTSSGGSIVIGKWHHGVCVFRAGGQSELYLDGRLENTQGSTVSFTFNGQGIVIGSSVLTGAGFFTGLEGWILHAAWYNRALNPTEVSKLWLDGPTGLLRRVPQWFIADPLAINNLAAGFQQGLALGASVGREPFFDSGFALGAELFTPDQYGVASQGFSLGASQQYDGELEKTVEKGFSLGSTVDTEPEIAAGFALGGVATFTLEDAYASFLAGFGLGGASASDIGELANGRYRR